MNTAFDAILIGSGHNALACAAHLSARGWRVGVFEQSEVLGGAVKTGEYTISGYRHDWAAMNLSLFAGSGFSQEYGADLTKHGLEFIPVDRPFASAFPDQSWCGVSTNQDETIASIRNHSTKDADTWQRMVAEFGEKAPSLIELLGNRMHLHTFAAFLFKQARKKGILGTGEFGRFLLSTPRAFLEETFESPKVRAMLGTWGLHLDFAPDIAGGALFPYLEGMAGQAFGMVLGKGGADTMIRAMAMMIQTRGGHIETGARVARILHNGSRAHGIELADGRRFSADRAVIAGVAPGALPKLTSATEPKFDAAMKRFKHAPGTMMIHLALDGLPDWAAGRELQRFAYVHLAPSLDQMAQTYQQANAGLLPSEPAIVVGQPTVFDPSRAPAGKHVLWLQVRMVPGTIAGDAKGEISATDWTHAAEPMAKRALDILECYAPGTRTKILGQRIVTPQELEADNPNLVGGDQLCGSHHLAQNFLFRPAFGHADGRTPIRNLHLTGAGVWPGAGTGAGSGYLLARKLAR